MSDEKTQSEPESQAQSEPQPQPEPEPKPEQKNIVTNSDIVGKKVFFLYPSVNIQNHVISELAQQEYEVYVVKNHVHFTRTLKKYPNSIIYVNLDDSAPKKEMEKLIETVSSVLPTVKIGIFSSSTDEEFKKKYINKPRFSCGFMNIRLDINKAAQKIIETLESMDVKGRRKYLRASTENEATATINMPHDGNFINGAVKDVSVVGISCVFESDPVLKKNTLYKDIQIRLQTMLLKAEAVVFGSRTEYGKTIYVLLFTQRIDPDVRTKIRKYIQQNLQHKMDSELK
jgi:hypothetical protein